MGLFSFIKNAGVKIFGGKIDDDIAAISGMAYDQATKEKVVLVVGNSAGSATVDDQMTVEYTEPETQFHTVVSGDTLGKIAKTCQNYKTFHTNCKFPL